MTTNYPPHGAAGGGPAAAAQTEQFGMPPGGGTVHATQPPHADPLSVVRPDRLRSRETVPGYRTTEFGVFVVMVIGNLLASALVASGDGHGDYFRADKAWFYITLLAIAYIISRGLAKIGVRDRD
jgi:hypothetical protein